MTRSVLSEDTHLSTALLPENLTILAQKEGLEEAKPHWGQPLPALVNEDGTDVESQKPEKAERASQPVSSTSDTSSELINFYRRWGHRLASLDPLGLQVQKLPEGIEAPSMHDTALASTLKKAYCGTLALEATHMDDINAQTWLYDVFEGRQNVVASLTSHHKKTLFTYLIQATHFEKFLAIKFPGAKRFGLEGLESVIPALCLSLTEMEKKGDIHHTAFSMAHRGRLNVMAHVLNKPLEWFFAQFQGAHPDVEGSGDVKYHMGATTEKRTLLPNPSHLESVNSVVLGWARALQDHKSADDSSKILNVLIHGDASFIGQGVVSECFSMAGLSGYDTRGSVHLILNNQVGFTAMPQETRSSPYASDLAKGFGVPILHVNADDVENVYRALTIAFGFRQRFARDIVVDVVGYRRNGHNEIDEPSFTQPLMYQKVAHHSDVLSLYETQLMAEKILKEPDIKAAKAKTHDMMLRAFDAASLDPQKAFAEQQNIPSTVSSQQETGISQETLERIGQIITEVPKGFNLHPKLNRFLEGRLKMSRGETPLDWAMGEALAFGSLLEEGYTVRLSGQDVGRGTFTQRHAVWTDSQTGYAYTSFNALSSNAKATFVNSLLSEMAVMGFEFGYSVASPKSLVLWEGQFGDFANGAQIIIDQYLAASQTKWGQASSLVLLLPHGLEGQGPEHSSARLERFLQLAAENNMCVANCSTPANYFHILRRQMHEDLRRPLVLMTPKSLLRHKIATSLREECSLGTAFQPVIGDTMVPQKSCNRVVLCSGKIYYDLLAKRTELKVSIPLIRIEELYPFPSEKLRNILTPFASPQTALVWAQEESYNQGAWLCVRDELAECSLSLGCRGLMYAGRMASAAPATGYASVHAYEQEVLIKHAFGIE